MKKYIFLLLLSLPLYADTVAKIIGGEDAESVGAQVALFTNTGHLICGGSLIAPDWVLTAAHCITDDLNHIGYGDIDKKGDMLIEDINSVFIHPGYSQQTTHDRDTALLKLSNPIDNQIIKISGKTVIADEMLNVSGWGATLYNNSDGSHAFPDVLQTVIVPVVDHQTCKKSYSKYGETITDQMICAGYKTGGKDSCQGDSGGPIKRVSDGEQVGVVSFGIGCGLDGGLYGVYAKPDIDWITRTIMQNYIPDGHDQQGGSVGFWFLIIIFCFAVAACLARGIKGG